MDDFRFSFLDKVNNIEYFWSTYQSTYVTAYKDERKLDALEKLLDNDDAFIDNLYKLAEKLSNRCKKTLEEILEELLNQKEKEV